MDDISNSTLLSELCSVCNTTKFKYRCPGCDARTCSLPCYKRHQQWAQCSGRRDPTKFVKKSQLLTPAGIDHDFNFLSKIERNMDKADRVAANATAPAPEQGLSNRQRAGVPYSKLEMAAGVTVIRAPPGLSRQRDNKSHMSATKKASRNIVWTVEWIDYASSRRVLTQTSSVQLIKDAQPFAPHATEAKSKKRKLNTEAPAPAAPAASTPDASQSQQSQHYYVKSVAEIQEQSLLPLHVDAETPIDHASQGPVSPGRGDATPRWADQGRQAAAKRQTDVPDIHHSHPDHDERAPEPMDHGRQPKFFLLKPRTSTTRKVLIPLDSSSTIAESLRGRTVLEFPTIHMFPPDLGELPKDEFMLEEEYAELEGEQQKEFDELMEELDPEILRRLKEGEDGPSRDGVGAVGEEEVDSKKILDVLKQDLGGRL